MIKNDYIQRTYAGWLGKIIGIRLGSPIEQWTYEQIARTYGDVKDYLVDYQDYAADDDSNGPLFFVRALKDYHYEIDKITEKEMGYTWLNYAPQNRGFFWWGGYGVSTEHTAYLNLKNNINAPRSGSIEQNGLACAEQIGGQIFSDCWGFVAPNNPELAAKYAAKMSSVSHDGEGIYGGMFVAACISLAYEEDDILTIIRKALALLPADSKYVEVSNLVIDFYLQDKEKNWRSCMKMIQETHGYDKYPGACHIIPNAAVMILSMVYGEGDYSRTQYICNTAGWDTDCNAGNVGAILGVMVGIDNIEDKWITPINDLLISSSVLGSLNISTVAQGVQVFCDLGYKIAGIEPPKEWQEYLGKEDYCLQFKLPKSTQAMRVKGESSSVEASITNTDEQLYKGSRSLKMVANRLGVASEVYLYHKTYYQPHDLHDSRYDPSFTPIVYPGQLIKTALYNNSGFDIYAKIYAYDINNDIRHESKAYKLAANWQELDYRIPQGEGSLIKEVGLVLYRDGDTQVGDSVLNIYMGYLEFTGCPHYNIDFTKEQIEDFGFGHSGPHTENSQFTYLNGFWELDGDSLSGSCSTEGEAYTGYYYLRDYAYEVIVEPQIGYHHLMNFRVQGGARSYAFGFYGKNQVALLKKHKDYELIKKVDFDFKMGKEYRFKAEAKGNQFVLFIDNKEVFTYVDDNQSYDYGQVGMTVLEGSHCHYKAVQIQELVNTESI